MSTSIETSSEPASIPLVKLGGLWRNGCASPYLDQHQEMLKKDLETDSIRASGMSKVSCNVALFSLALYSYSESSNSSKETIGSTEAKSEQCSSLIEVLFKSENIKYWNDEEGSFSEHLGVFRSGGWYFLDKKCDDLGQPLLLYPVRAMITKIEGEIAKCQDKMRDCFCFPKQSKIILTSEKLTSLESNLQSIKHSRERLDAFNCALNACRENCLGKDISNTGEESTHVFDAEQLAIVVINQYFMNMDTQSMKEMILPAGQKLRLVVHIHTKLDMCPFCLRTLYLRVQQWNSAMQDKMGVPVLAIVSSREEFSPTLLSLVPYCHKGRSWIQSMRSLGLDSKSGSPVTENDLLNGGEKGKETVFQFPFLFCEAYECTI